LKSIPYPAESRQARIAAVIGPAILAIFIGAFLVFGAGLAHPSTIHDFSHDTRHALAFPCH
jgi:cobalt transporter subunit CbtB